MAGLDHGKTQQLVTTSPYIRGWYTSAQGPSSVDSILQEAYEAARDELLTHVALSDEEQRLLLDPSSSSPHELRGVLERAKAAYCSKPTSKARTWLTAFSSRVQHYEKVFDVLAQHHAEYVCLAWGALKFVFMGVMSHEKITKQLAKACSQIADLLPRTDLCVNIYQTERVQVAVARLYASIMNFIIQAIRWYRQGRLAHVWTAISKPWEVELAEHVDNIGDQARRVDSIAQSAAMAELRDVHVEIQQMGREFQRLSASLQADYERLLQCAQVSATNQAQLHADVAESKTMIAQVQLAQILNMPFLAALPTSGESLEYCQSLQVRSRHQRTRLQLPSTAQLESWSRHERSSFLLMRSTSTLAARNFTVRLINLIRSSGGCNVLWALRFPDYWATRISFTDVCRMLLKQALQLNPGALTCPDHPVTATALREAASESDWLVLLNRVLRGVPRVYIVLDADLLNHGLSGDRYTTTKLLEMLPKLVQETALKIFISNFVVDQSYVTRHWDREAWDVLKTDCLEQREIARHRLAQHRVRVRRNRQHNHGRQ